MRRQRVLRTASASASSLCIFCACRLGAIDLPASATSLQRSQSRARPALQLTPQRRSISTSRVALQSAATSSHPADNGPADPLPPWYDPQSTLSLSEQREKAHRNEMRQKLEAEQDRAKQEQIRKEQSERDRARAESEAKRKAESEARARRQSPGHRTVVLDAAPKDEVVPVRFYTLGQAMLAGRKEERAGQADTFTRRLRLTNGEKGTGDSNNVAGRQAPQETQAASARPVGMRIRMVVPVVSDKQDSRSGDMQEKRSGDKKSQAKRSAPASGSGDMNPPKKVSNPFEVPAMAKATNKDRSKATTASGWGFGSTQTAPLQYGDAIASDASTSVLSAGEAHEDAEPNENIQDASEFQTNRSGLQKSFKPKSDVAESTANSTAEVVEDQHRGDEHQKPEPVTEYQILKDQNNEPVIEQHTVSDQGEELRAQQSVYDRGSRFFEDDTRNVTTRSKMAAQSGESRSDETARSYSGRQVWGARSVELQPQEAAKTKGDAQTAEQQHAESTEPGTSEAFSHEYFLEQAGYVESAASNPEPMPEDRVFQDPTPPSTETGAPGTQTSTEAPVAIPYSSEPSQAAVKTGSFGYFDEEAGPTTQPRRQESPQVQQRVQRLEQPESRYVETEPNTSSFGSFESDEDFTPETRRDDTPQQAKIPSGPSATPSPMAQMADQTQRKQPQEWGSLNRSAQTEASPTRPTAQTAAFPPPPPTVAPPPVAAIPPGGQIAWQPVAGHPHGGQWVWQPSPPPAYVTQSATPPQIEPNTTRDEPLSSQRSSFIPPVRAPEPPSISIGDSGYRATPFKADEYQPPSTFDESTAANWQHLRRKTSETAQPAQPAQPVQPAQLVKSAQEPVRPVQQQQSHQHKPQMDFDDETSVDKTFANHLREREDRFRVQKGREQKRQTQEQESERQIALRQRAMQLPVDGRFDDPRRLYDGPAQAYKDKECGRCGEIGHIARFCPKANDPFAKPNGESWTSNVGSVQSRDTRNDRHADAKIQRPIENRDRDEGRTRNPFSIAGPVSDKVRNPFESRESGDSQRTRKVWGVDQVIPTEPAEVPRHEPRFEMERRFVPGQGTVGAQIRVETNVQSRFEPVGGRRTERDEPARSRRGDREEDSRPARVSVKTEVQKDIDEQAPALETRASREKAARKSRWAIAEEDFVEDKGRGAGRKAQRAGRREYDENEDEEAEARERFRARKAARQAEKEAKEEKRRKDARKEREVRKNEDATPISIPEFVSVQQLSQLLGVRYDQFIDRLEELGYDDVFPGMTLNSETSGMIAMEYNFDPTIDAGVREEEERDLKPRPEVADKEFLPIRPPVVTIMGHVDHGKTTLLDYLRKSSVAAGEAGGITQHIGAFSVPMTSSGKTITFLDTPGHAAFLAMRQRGANVTDIVILVVAADDSVKPQTLEAIKHAKAASVPMIVAINKVDKPEADIERVKQDLARHGVEIEDFGGETQVVPVSGKTGQGMDELEETIVALSEILDHRAETDGAVEGWILEATTKERGRVATVLVRRGTLKPGAVIVAGKTWARVRTLQNEGGRILQEVGPGMPVEVDGWRDQPMAGDEVLQAPSEQKATSVVEFREVREEREKAAADMEAINESRRLASERQKKEREAAQALKQAQRTANAEGGTADVATTAKPDNLDAPQQEQTGQMKVPFIIKADVSGSAEAVSAYIMSVSNPLIAPSILHSQVGPVHESDIELASAARGHIIAFNLPPDPQMQGKAEAEGVKILENNIIYRVLDDVKAVLEEKLPPVMTQRVLGEAEIGASFDINLGRRKTMKIAGCKVRNGMVGRGARVRVLRGSEKIYDGTIASLKNVKKDVQEMRKGTECGMGFEGWDGFEVGDQVQTYEEISEKRKL